MLRLVLTDCFIIAGYWSIFYFTLVLSASSSTVNSLIVESRRWKTSHNGQIHWRSDCVFVDNDSISITDHAKDPSMTTDECAIRCFNQPLTCNHFSRNAGGDCTLMWGTKLTQQLETERSVWTCGYIPTQIWSNSSEDDRLVVKSNCIFPSSVDGRDVRIEKSFSSCSNACLDDHRCVAFSYNRDNGKCVIPHKSTENEKRPYPFILKDLFRLRSPTVSSSVSADCAIVVHRIWKRYFPDIFYQSNCDFIGSGIDELKQEIILNNDVDDCIRSCFSNQRCTHYSYYENGTCYLKKVAMKTERTATKGTECGYLPNKWNSTRTLNGSNIRFRKDCDFALKVIDRKLNMTVDDCMEECHKMDLCNYFSHDGIDCFLMFELELIQARRNRKGWTCGYVPSKIWQHLSEDHEQILVKFDCAFPSSSDVRIEKSLNSCQNSCLSDYRCNAYSYSSSDSKCVLPHKSIEFETYFSISSLIELFRLRSPLDSKLSECGVIPVRDWKVDLIGESGDGVLYQDDCDFNKGFDIDEPTKQTSFNSCVTHCFSVKRCTHFTYQNGICALKNAHLLTDRVMVRDGEICGYIPSRWDANIDDDRQRNGTLTHGYNYSLHLSKLII